MAVEWRLRLALCHFFCHVFRAGKRWPVTPRVTGRLRSDGSRNHRIQYLTNDVIDAAHSTLVIKISYTAKQRYEKTAIPN